MWPWIPGNIGQSCLLGFGTTGLGVSLSFFNPASPAWGLDGQINSTCQKRILIRDLNWYLATKPVHSDVRCLSLMHFNGKCCQRHITLRHILLLINRFLSDHMKRAVQFWQLLCTSYHQLWQNPSTVANLYQFLTPFTNQYFKIRSRVDIKQRYVSSIFLLVFEFFIMTNFDGHWPKFRFVSSGK